MLRFHCTDNGPVEDRVRFVQSFAQSCETAHMYRLVSRSQTVTFAVTVWTTAVKRFVLSSPGSRVGDKWLLSASGTAKGMNLITY